MFSDPTDFISLSESISNDMQTLAIHWRLYNDLRESIGEYENEFNQSTGFWSLTIEAQRETAMFRLCRLYDQHRSSLNLKNWLTAIKEHHGNNCEHPIEMTQLDQDISVVSDEDSIVLQLVKLRNNYLAHVQPKMILSSQLSEQNANISDHQVQTLIGRATDLINRYQSLLNKTTYSTTLVGHDDFKNILKLVRIAVQHLRNSPS